MPKDAVVRQTTGLESYPVQTNDWTIFRLSGDRNLRIAPKVGSLRAVIPLEQQTPLPFLLPPSGQA